MDKLVHRQPLPAGSPTILLFSSFPRRPQALDKPLAQPRVVPFERKPLKSRLELIGDTCLREFPKQWADKLPVLRKLPCLQHSRWQDAELAGNVSGKWRTSKEILFYLRGFKKKKKQLCFKMSVIVFQGLWWEMSLVRWECKLVFKVREASKPKLITRETDERL